MRPQFHDAFLSFASHDEGLARALVDLLAHCDMHAFFAPVALSELGTQDWREDLLAGLSNSAAFVPLLSPHSVTRPWVVYESGMAAALQVPVVPVRMGTIDAATNALAPIVKLQQVLDISSYDGIFHLACVLRQLKRQRKKMGDDDRAITHIPHNTSNFIRDRLELRKDLVSTVRALAGRRSVFIAGSLPQHDRGRQFRVTTHLEDRTLNLETTIIRICRELTRALLHRGFVIGSCPVVEVVGRIVAEEASQFFLDHQDKAANLYEIGGLYPANPLRDVRDPAASSQWRSLFRGFRRTYLANYEWLLIVGGNEGTMEEYEVAKELGTLKILSLPFLGGTGQKVWQELHPRHHFLPRPDSPTWSDTLSHRIIEHIDSTRF